MAIHFAEKSEMFRTQEIYVNSVVFEIFEIFTIFLDFLFWEEDWGGEVGSTSPRSGNQVDGLPPASSIQVWVSSLFLTRKYVRQNQF